MCGKSIRENQRRTFDNQIHLGDWFAIEQYTMGLMPNDHLCGDVANLRQKNHIKGKL